jgi:enoyl-CoA hydratase/carnithine racemase
MTSLIQVERDDRIATVVLNKPDKMNAMDKSMWQGLADAFAELSADDDLRCVVLRGAGGKAFSAGADIEEFRTSRANAAQAAAYGGLVNLVGSAIALEIVLEGRVFDAREAFEKRLVNRVVDDTEVLEQGYAAAKRIAAGAPLVARWHKEFVRRLAEPAPLTDAENAEAYACFDTEDFQIGFQAFLAKARPVFTGR